VTEWQQLQCNHWFVSYLVFILVSCELFLTFTEIFTLSAVIFIRFHFSTLFSYFMCLVCYLSQLLSHIHHSYLRKNKKDRIVYSHRFLINFHWRLYLFFCCVVYLFWSIAIWCTFNNISAISWQSVLLVEETAENHRPAASHWQTLSHNAASSTSHLNWIRTQNVIGDRH
jgi:predicted membrane protein